MAAAARTILEDRPGIAAEMEHLDWNAVSVKSIFEAANTWSERLTSEAETTESLRLLVHRVELDEHGIKISLALPAARDGAHLELTRLIPTQLRRRGIEMKFVIGGDSLVSRRSDPALVKLIGRARCWFEDLLSGRAHSMVDIGKREKVGKRYVSRVIRFAFLAPNIIEQIAGDQQPPDFTAESLLRGQAELPLAWYAQRKLLGFSPPA